MIFALVADGALLTSLAFGVLYLWISAPNWPPAVRPETNLSLALATVAGLFIAAAGRTVHYALVAGNREPRIWIGVAAVALFASIAALVVLIANVIPHPREHALGPTTAALLAYVALHAGIGLLFLSVMSCVLPAASCRRASYRSPPDPALDRLYDGHRRGRDRPRLGIARAGRHVGNATLMAPDHSGADFGREMRNDGAPVRSVPAGRLWLLALGFCVCGAALAIVYVLHSAGCAFGWSTDAITLEPRLGHPHPSRLDRLAVANYARQLPTRGSARLARSCIG